MKEDIELASEADSEASTERQKESALKIPSQFEEQRPHVYLSIRDLMGRLENVTQGGQKNVLAGRKLISQDEPNADLGSLFAHVILPNPKVIDEMNGEFGQLWQKGEARSIIDFTSLGDDKEVRYPLPALEVYREFNRANMVRMEWRRAQSWMQRGRRTAELDAAIGLVKRLMYVFEWGADLRALDTTSNTSSLLKILNDGMAGWLTDDHIDMLMQVLTDRLELTHEEPNVKIASCFFQHYVEQAYKRRGTPNTGNHPFLLSFCGELQNGRLQVLYLVGHVNGNHWVPWKLDFRASTLSHGDSLSMNEGALEPLKNSLLWWMETLYIPHKECTYLGNTLPHGTQVYDHSSCGIVAYNAIAHDILGDELWTEKNSKRHRIEVFISIVLRHNEKKSLFRSENGGRISPSHVSEGVCDGKADVSVMPESQPVMNNNAAPQDDNNAAPQDDLMSGSFGNNTFACKLSVDSSEFMESDRDSQEDGSTDYNHFRPPSSSSSNASSCSQFLEDDQKTKNLKRQNHDSGESDLERVHANPSSDVHQSRPRFKKHKQNTLDVFFGLRGSHPEGSNEDDDSSDDEETDDVVDDMGATDLEMDHGPVPLIGRSKSATHERKFRADYLSGNFTVKPHLHEQFKARIFKIDPHAKIIENGWKVQHSPCLEWLRMSGAYSAKKFVKHVRTCKVCPRSSLLAYNFTSQREISPNSKKSAPRVAVPCSGLTVDHDSRIQTYLSRLTALGGGGPSKYSIAREKYRKEYGELNKKQKEAVSKLNEKDWAWVIKHERAAVFSVKCPKTVMVRTHEDSDEEALGTCAPCLDLLKDRRFRKAISLPEPDKCNAKYANKPFRQEVLGRKFMKSKGLEELVEPRDSQTRLAVRYAVGVAEGKFSDSGLFADLVNVFLQKMDCAARGKRLNNFKYPPLFDEFITTVYMLSPRTYRLLSHHFPLRHVRSITQKRAKESQFTGGISEHSFDMVDEFVTKVDSPLRHIALSVDDTKLLPTFKPFFDRDAEAWYIVGGVGESLLVSDPGKLREELDDAQLRKATKVRVWVASIPLPGVPPIAMCAMAITDEDKAETLWEYTMEIFRGLWKRNIWVVSYACDGLEKERVAQKLLQQRAHAIDTKTIQSPSPGIRAVVIKIPSYDAKPIALVQDSRHALKTLRNNLFSGTRTLVFGNFVALYQDIRGVAMDPDSPLYNRDVEKSDKQDDRAAARIYSSFTLQLLIKKHPDGLGIIMFLFIFGELVDAIQNRSISHLERFKMIRRTSYFVEIWVAFLEASNYSRKVACLSREALDIINMISSGYEQLLVIYRDHFLATRVPFIPWLHSTEVCEHIFGECRKEVKDFDFAAFLHLMPKIHVLVRHAMKYEDIVQQNPKAQAGGYAHIWFDLDGFSAKNLAIFPTDSEMQVLVKDAYKEAEAIWCELGVYAIDVLTFNNGRPLSTPLKNSEVDTSILPHFSALWDDDEDDDYDGDDDDKHDDSEEGCAVLEGLIERDEYDDACGPIRHNDVEQVMLNVSCAKQLLDFDTLIRIDKIILPTKEEGERHCQEYKKAIGKVLADSLPDVAEPGPLQLSRPSSGLTLSRLLELRWAHETEFAKKAVRVRGTTSKDSEDGTVGQTREQAVKKERTARQKLVSKINETLRTQQDIGPGTGVGRRVRWTGKETTGNAANAEAAAEDRSSKAKTKRLKIYSKSSLPSNFTQLLSNAGVDEVRPIREGVFGIVFVKDRLFIARVITLYSKGGGEHGRHSWVESVASITRLSYIVVQTYEQVSDAVFRELHTTSSMSRMRRFAHLTPAEFLYAFTDLPSMRPHLYLIELSHRSFQVWNDILTVQGRFSSIMEEFKKRK